MTNKIEWFCFPSVVVARMSRRIDKNVFSPKDMSCACYFVVIHVCEFITVAFMHCRIWTCSEREREINLNKYI